MRISSPLALATAAMLVLLAAPAAHAATVSSEFFSDSGGEGIDVEYASATGEPFDLKVVLDGRSVRFHDPGVVIQPKGSCHSVTRHTVACRALTRDESPVSNRHGESDSQIRVQLSNHGGSATIASTRFPGFISVKGGSGSDRLDAGRSHDDVWLDGASGRDVLIGGSGDDSLGASGGGSRLVGGPGNDTLDGSCSGWARFDGGSGSDTIEYDCRAPVLVDLARRGGNGVRGHGHDRLVNIENASTGLDNAVLRGNRAANTLTGEGAHDTLAGRGGNDRLVAAGFDDRLDGGAGDDRLDLTDDAAHPSYHLSCGPGQDLLQADAPFSLAPHALTRGCEALAIGDKDRDSVTVLRRPIRLMADGLHGIAVTCGPHVRSSSRLEAWFGLAFRPDSQRSLDGSIRRRVGSLRLRVCPPRQRTTTLPLSARTRHALLHGAVLYGSFWAQTYFQDGVIVPLRFDRHGRLVG